MAAGSLLSPTGMVVLGSQAAKGQPMNHGLHNAWDAPSLCENSRGNLWGDGGQGESKKRKANQRLWKSAQEEKQLAGTIPDLPSGRGSEVIMHRERKKISSLQHFGKTTILV